MEAQIIGIGIFWVAGCAIVYFFVRDESKSTLANLRAAVPVLPVLGAIAGFVLYALALATTGPDNEDYREPSYFSRTGR